VAVVAVSLEVEAAVLGVDVVAVAVWNEGWANRG